MTDTPSRAAIGKALEAAGHSDTPDPKDRPKWETLWNRQVRAHARMIDKYEPVEDAEAALRREVRKLAEAWTHTGQSFNALALALALALAGIRRGMELPKE